MHAYYLLMLSIARLSAARAASCNASDNVGWAWIVRCRSSLLAEYSIASTASAISSPASGPMMCTPRISSSSCAAMSLTNPAVDSIARAAAGRERKLADLVSPAARLHLLLRLANPGNFRVGVDHRRNDVVVHVAVFAGDHVTDHHAFILRLVRQHRAAHAVADGIDVLGRRLAVIVHGDEATFVDLHARTFGQQFLRIRTAAD